MKIHPNTQEAYQLLQDGVLALARAERQGMCVNMDYIRDKQKELIKKSVQIEDEFKQSQFFKDWQKSINKSVNIYSTKQLGEFLYGVRNIKPIKTTPTGKGSTDEESLKQLNIPELQFYEEKTGIKKSLDVLDGFEREQVDGVIHPVFNLHIARTYRSSSDSPNFQNIPVRDKEMMNTCRGALFPRPGHQLLEVDFGQLEVRIAAAYNKDETLIYDILHGDMHSDIAQQLFFIDKIDKSNSIHKLLRYAAKNGFVFPQFYGSYYKNCAVNIAYIVKLPQGKWKPSQGISLDEGTLSDHMINNGIRSFDKFIEHIKKIEDQFWNVRYQTYTAWKERHWLKYQRKGYIDTFTGFRFTGLMGKNDAINYPIQCTAFNGLLWSLIQKDRYILNEKLDTRIISQIHDSLLFDVHPDELEQVISSVKKITCTDLPNAWKWINVPLEIDADLAGIDQSWAEKKRYPLA
jgi:DNA polymerase-1